MTREFDIPRSIISEVLLKQTGMLIPAEKIDFITTINIAQAIVALDEKIISRKKFNRIVIFNLNILLERECYKLFYTPAKPNASGYTKFHISIFYN